MIRVDSDTDRAQLRRSTLAEEAVVCQQCGARLQAGRQVCVYAYREPDTPEYTVGNVWCDLPDHSPLTKYTLGLRELRVTGTIGQCSDVRTQSTWQVLLNPTIEHISPAATNYARSIEPDAASTHNGTGRAGTPEMDPTTPHSIGGERR